MTQQELTKEFLLNLAHKANDYAMSKDIEASEVFFHKRRKLEIMVEGKSIANERDVDELGFGIRVLKNSSEGFSYTNKIELNSLTKCVEDAIGIATIAPKKEGIRFPSPSKYSVIDGLYSDEISNLGTEEIVSNVKLILEPIKQASVDINLNLSSIRVDEDWQGIVNSLGIDAFEKSNSYSGGFFCVARDGDKIGSFVVETFYTKDPGTVDYSEFTDKLIKKAVRNIGTIIPKSIDSDTVIFQEGAIFNPLMIVIGSSVSADNVQQNRSVWKDKLADTVAVDSLNIDDDPLNIQGGGNVRSFDDEGTPTSVNSIIKDGILENFLFDELRASRVGAVSTGNCWRSFGGTRYVSPPSMIFPNAPSIKPGSMSTEELIEDVKEGIIFDRFSGSFQTENGIYSGVTKGAQLIKNGEITTPVTNVTIGGNVFEVLMNIVGIGKDIQLIDGYLRTPLIKVKGVNIATQ
ncbi:MAG: TldD/PmbA family protein [Candidatus Heimdallarchaeota archaeon]|nr:TldD/PmbA family protein [Candidatus Heimdallarchaeota archaeon]MCK4254796.1 TldD/PmbA family protein [Candidatus Heimdallarchaeota archaeon]